MTYSIVAVDRTTGQIGVAVQTCMPAVGAAVPWAEPGVGAVATQAFADAAYGPRCLGSLRAAKTPHEALEAAQGVDPTPMIRQVAVIDASGASAVTTGAGCVDHAGHLVGDGYSVQANMAGSPDVWPAMAAVLEESTDAFAWRLLAALRAADEAGGDARGRMSAALLIVEGESTGPPGSGRVVDLRVDRSTDPLTELADALRASENYRLFFDSVERLFGGDAAGSLATIERGLEALPDEGNFVFMRVGALLATGDTDSALRELRALVDERAGWGELFRGFVSQGLMRLPEGMTVDDVLRRATGRTGET